MFLNGKLLHFFLPIIFFLVFSLSNCASEDSSSGSGSDSDNTTTSTDNSSATTSSTTAPTVSSFSPEDNSTNVAVSTTVSVTFSESMSTSTITTNTDNTTCSGSFQLSSDNFTTCIKMSSAPSSSNSEKTFTVTPEDNLSRGTNYKIKITTSAADTLSNSLSDNYTSNGFTTYGTGTIGGTVRYDNNTAADNVSVSFALSGTIVDNTTTNSSGDYSQDNLSLGTYTLTFTKSNFNDASLLSTLATDNQSITENVTLLADNCSAGTVSGTITNAVSGDGEGGVSITVRSGLNVKSGSTTGIDNTTASNGTYTLSSMNTGGYTIEASKDGFISAYLNVNVCGNLIDQNTNVSRELSSGTMRIVLHWGASSGLRIVDSHLTGPDNASGRFHLYYGAISGLDAFYYATNSFSCSGCTLSQSSDNVTLDKDDTQAPGTETITIPGGSWRSGTYRYSAHDYTTAGTNDGNASSTKFAESGTTVKVYYNNEETTFNVPNIAGTVWKVFTIDGDSKVITLVNSMTAVSRSGAGTRTNFE